MQRLARTLRTVARSAAVAALALASVVTAGCAGLGTAPTHTTEAVSSGALGTKWRARRPADGGRRATIGELAPSLRATRPEDVRQLLSLAGAGTYIGEVLLDRDSSLTRWPERVQRPLTVWIGDAARLDGWQPGYRAQVRAAFKAWQDVGIPVRFAEARDSASADVQVGWVPAFKEPISGKTVWTRDDRWWIVDADITLALHHRDGAPLDSAQVRAIALHEIGHLLGLDHTSDATNIMAPRVRVRDLSPADLATVRLLYSVPAGRVR